MQRNLIAIGIALVLGFVIVIPVSTAGWTWQVENVDPGSDVMWGSSIALDSSGYPHISYCALRPYCKLKYAWKDRSNLWSRETVDSNGDVGKYSSLKLSPVNDIPVISYWDAMNNKLKYAEKNPDTGWWNTVLDPDTNAGKETSLALGSSGRPHISYTASSGTGLYYASWDDTGWHYTVVDADGFDGSLALDKYGVPSFSYWGSNMHSLHFAREVCLPPHPPFPGGCLFVTETVDAEGVYRHDSSLAFDSAGNAHISYVDGPSTSSRHLMHATEAAGSWVFEDIGPIGYFTGYGSNGDETSIAIDSAGNPAISYHGGEGNEGLKFAWKDAGGWHTMTIDSGDVGQYPSLVFDRAGNAHISYMTFGFPGYLKYAKGTPVASGIKPLPGYPLPTDPDRDGIYEDLNGNGRLDFADVVLYFNQMSWISANEPIPAFDLNANGRIDFADIVALFNEI